MVSTITLDPRGIRTDATNGVSNPAPFAGTGWTTPSGVPTPADASWSSSGRAVTVVASGSSTPYLFTAPHVAAVAVGDRVTLGIDTAGSGGLTHVQVRPHNNSGNIYYSPGAIVAKGSRVVVTWVADVAIPAGQLNVAVAGYSDASGTLAPAGAGLLAGAATIEIGEVFTAGAYYSGATPAAGAYSYAWAGLANASASYKFVADPDTTTAAIFALGYEVERAVRTIVHDVPDAAAPPVTFKPAGPRSGTIQYLFSARETCRRAEIIHTRPGYITLTDTDWPDGPMRYVAQGEVVSRLDPETLELWILETGFAEV